MPVFRVTSRSLYDISTGGSNLAKLKAQRKNLKDSLKPIASFLGLNLSHNLSLYTPHLNPLPQGEREIGLILSPERLRHNQRETTSASTRNRRSGDEALERGPFIAKLWGSKSMKRIPFPTRPITHNFERPRSKAEEPDCLFRRNPPSIMITTQSPRGKGNGGNYFLFSSIAFSKNLIPSWETLIDWVKDSLAC